MNAFVVTGQRARQMRVVPAEVLKRLYARSNRHGLVQTAAHAALLVAGGWKANPAIPRSDRLLTR